MGSPLNLHALVFTEGSEWVAHCLELDLVDTGPTAEAAMDALAEAVSTQIGYAHTHDNLEHLFHPAPADAWQRFGELLKGLYRTVVRVLPDRGQEFALQSLLAA
jgi:hypothetical protein